MIRGLAATRLGTGIHEAMAAILNVMVSITVVATIFISIDSLFGCFNSTTVCGNKG